jgi:class 3 adenylate cyclase/tetratricopeptide (TPR) repeat protein
MRCAACAFDNPEGFRFCGRCGQGLVAEAASPPPPRPAEGERRSLTVLFCDLVDSTAMSTRLDPEDLREVLRAYQETSAAVIDRYAGHVAQYLGDGLLVYFGYPVAHEEDALRAVLAGLEIVDAIAQIGERVRLEYGVRLSVRVGIHTGVVVTDLIGTDLRGERLALGQVPNVAARLQSLAAPDTVVLSDATGVLVEKSVQLESLGVQPLKGIEAPVEVLRAIRQRSGNIRFDGARTASGSGRSVESARLRELVRAGIERGAVNVLVTGHAGIGKSHLVHGLNETRELAAVRWLVGQCSPFHANSAFFPLTQPLGEMLGLEPQAPASRSLDRLSEAVTRLDLDPQSAVPLLAGFFSIPLDARFSPPEGSAQRTRERTVELLVRLLCETARRSALAVLVEDAHWIDPSTLDLLRALLARDDRAGLLLLLTARPEFNLLDAASDRLERIDLAGLGAEEARALVRATAPGLPDALVETIVARADGVPLFLVELAKSLAQTSRTGDGGEPVAIPATLHGLLSARLDKLGVAREVAQIAAVIGREFDAALLRVVAPVPQARLEACLGQLQAEDLIRADGDRFAFRHALIQAAAYDSLLRKSRRTHHLAIATALSQQFPQTVATQPELVAHHFTEAGDCDRAVPLWLAAGQRSMGLSSNLEAISHLERALGLIERTAPQSQAALELGVRLALGSALMGVRGYGAPELQAHYQRALEIAERLPDGPERFWPLMGLCYFHLVRAEFDAALALARELVRLGDALADPTLRFGAHQALGMALYWHGDFRGGARHLEEAMALDREGRTFPLVSPTGEDPRGPVLSFLAWCRWHEGDVPAALALGRRALTIAEDSQFPYGVIYTLICSAMLHQHCGDAARTAHDAERMLEINQGHGFFFQPVGNILRGWAQSWESTPGCVERIAAGLDGYRVTGARMCQTYYLSLLADASLRVGRVADAQAQIAQALALAEQTGEYCWTAELHRQRGAIAERLGDRATARAEFQRAAQRAQAQGSAALQQRAVADLDALEAGFSAAS